MSENLIISALSMQEKLADQQRTLYVETVTNINMRYRELLKNDFGTTLVKNCASDIAGEIVRRYFDTADYYITIDQMTRRIVHFSYENDYDPLKSNESTRKALYNISDSSQCSAFLKGIEQQNSVAQKKMFEKVTKESKNGVEYKKYEDDALMTKGKDDYRKLHPQDVDELSGKQRDDLQVDHVQAAATASYNSKYLRDEDVIQTLKEFYNSPDNFQMLAETANRSKGDARVYSDGSHTISGTEMIAEKKLLTEKYISVYRKQGYSSKDSKLMAREDATNEIEAKYTDITFKASAEEVAQAVCDRWENTKKEETINKLKEEGHLGPDGKVPPEVRKELQDRIRHSMNAESVAILRGTSYRAVANDAFLESKSKFGKIVMGQAIYYILPPLVFEIQQIVRKKNINLDRFLNELKNAQKRIIRYVKDKMGDILKNIAFNSFHKFIKSFFDIIISLVKETVKRLMRVVKTLVMSLVQCVRTVADKHSTAAQKADAITKILAVSITSVVCEVIFEWIEDNLGINDYITEPLQLIITIIITNTIMLILQKADLFDVQYGLLVANIESVFKEERSSYLEKSEFLLSQNRQYIDCYMNALQKELENLQNSIESLDMYSDDASDELEKFNQMFQIGIDFELEWKHFCTNN